MQIKINQATNNRPEGDRIIDAPAVLVDIQQYIGQLKKEDAWQKSDKAGDQRVKDPEAVL